MIIITIQHDHALDQPDELGRTRTGYREGMGSGELYEVARGSWKLGERAAGEHYALITFDNLVRQAVEIRRLVATVNGRSAIEGNVLNPGHPVYDEYVNKPSPVPSTQNPIRYFDSPIGHKPCGCGCGQLLASGRFAAGHDQTALHQRVKQIGTVDEFLDWFDAVAGPFVKD
ncbi:hypothetical protein LO763_22345 [Glycomyces sp. A-F 0318]|uniref:hypothetical protein n=1 Tax=Glycomyces amatae TaxID=2881355 RepID=UPI001E5037B9|nr:hypothetical protein [Glycomyces amatae]MCD0446359.1 hypothetical protein [Glycomyces amatae]